MENPCCTNSSTSCCSSTAAALNFIHFCHSSARVFLSIACISGSHLSNFRSFSPSFFFCTFFAIDFFAWPIRTWIKPVLSKSLPFRAVRLAILSTMSTPLPVTLDLLNALDKGFPSPSSSGTSLPALFSGADDELDAPIARNSFRDRLATASDSGTSLSRSIASPSSPSSGIGSLSSMNLV